MSLSLFARGSADVSPCGLYRYTLDRVLDGSGMPLCFVMLNPSTADADADDNTIRRCIGFGNRLDRSSIRVVNLFAYRTPYPKELRAAYTRGDDVVGPLNDKALVELPGTIICAWGPPKWAFVRERAATVANMFTTRGLPLFCLGTAEGGSPRHPLMLRNDAALVPWSMP